MRGEASPRAQQALRSTPDMQPDGTGTDNNYSFLKHGNLCTSADNLTHESQEDSAGEHEKPEQWWLHTRPPVAVSTRPGRGQETACAFIQF